jgi:hypothetical protein
MVDGLSTEEDNMDQSRFDELSGMKKPPKLYFVITDLSGIKEFGWQKFPIVDGLMGKQFDFGSILRVVESSDYCSGFSGCKHGYVETGVSMDDDEYYVEVPLYWVFENDDEAKRARANALCQFYSDGMRHCRVNEQII